MPAILEIPPKYSVSEVMGMLKGKTAIKMFQNFSEIGLDEEKIRKYVQHQEDEERQEEFQQQEFGF